MLLLVIFIVKGLCSVYGETITKQLPIMNNKIERSLIVIEPSRSCGLCWARDADTAPQYLSVLALTQNAPHPRFHPN